MVMKKITGMLQQRQDKRNAANDAAPTNGNEKPEETAARSVRLFCESAGPSNGDEEVLHLPPLVFAAESSPSAAAAAAKQIRKFLGRDYYNKGHIQYNAIMLIRILSDNPGQSFTRNFDERFVNNMIGLLHYQKDPSIQQIAYETLSGLQRNKSNLEGVGRMLKSWHEMYGKRPPQAGFTSWQNTHAPNYQLRVTPTPSRKLPPPDELAQRISEANSSATLLGQLITMTPSHDLVSPNSGSENLQLLNEFVERCRSAQTSMQRLIECTDPEPDEHTLETLIQTSERLALVLSKQQRAMLAARREAGRSPSVQSETAAPYIPHASVVAEAGGSRQMTEEEQLAALGVRDDHENGSINGDERATEDPFADHNARDWAYAASHTNGTSSRDKGKGAYVSPIEPTLPNIPELPNPSPQPRHSPNTYSSSTHDYGFPTQPPTTSPPLPPITTKPRRPPPPTETPTEILNNAYSRSPPSPPTLSAPPPAPPTNRAELSAQPAQHKPQYGDDAWSATRSHWSNLANGNANAAPGNSDGSLPAPPPPPPPSQPPRPSSYNYSIPEEEEPASDDEDGVNGTTMHGALGVDTSAAIGQRYPTTTSFDDPDFSFTSSQPSSSPARRRPPPVPKVPGAHSGSRLTRENVLRIDEEDDDGEDGLDGGYGGYGGGESRMMERYGSDWGNESFVHYNGGGGGRMRDV